MFKHNTEPVKTLKDSFDDKINILLDKYSAITSDYLKERFQLTTTGESKYSTYQLNKMLDDISNCSNMIEDLIRKRSELK